MRSDVLLYRAAPGQANRLTVTEVRQSQAPGHRFRLTDVVRIQPGADCALVPGPTTAVDCRGTLPSGINTGSADLGRRQRHGRLTVLHATFAVIAGGPGDDIITSTGATWTHLTGGPGNDRITGGSAHDRIDGEVGDDVLPGGAGRDTIAGNEEHNTLQRAAMQRT